MKNTATRRDEISENTRSIELANKKISELRYIPKNVVHLAMINNGLRQISAKFPASLTVLQISYNPIAKLPALPDSLAEFYCCFTNLAELPALPPNLLELRCRSCKLRQLPPFGRRLQIVDCSDNYLIDLPKIPKGFWHLESARNIMPAVNLAEYHIYDRFRRIFAGNLITNWAARYYRYNKILAAVDNFCAISRKISANVFARIIYSTLYNSADIWRR